MKKKKQPRQIMFHIWIDKKHKIRNKQIAICKVVNAKLEMLGFKHIDFDETYVGPYFLIIFNDKKAGWTSSITPACCMANIKRRPLPIQWLYDHFDWIMDKHMNFKCWTLLENIAYEYNYDK